MNFSSHFSDRCVCMWISESPSRCVTRAETDEPDLDEDDYYDDLECCSDDQLQIGHPVDLVQFFQPQTYDPKRFMETRYLARAMHGEIRLATDKLTGKDVVLKVVKNQKLRPRTSSHLESCFVESCVMNYLWSHETFYDPLFIAQTYDLLQDDQYTYIVQEVCEGGELYKLLKIAKVFGEPIIKTIALQLIFALMSLHLNGICHRDVSLENVLLSDEGSVRLIDFGQADLWVDHGGNMQLLSGTAGKTYYRAPEMYFGAYFGPPVDVFALGVLIYLLATGRPPWNEATPQDPSYRFISSGPSCLRETIPLDSYDKPRLSDSLIDLLTAILYCPAAARPTLGQILQHPWLASTVEPWEAALQACHKSPLVLQWYRRVTPGSPCRRWPLGRFMAAIHPRHKVRHD